MTATDTGALRPYRSHDEALKESLARDPAYALAYIESITEELDAIREKLVDAEVALNGETAQREHFTAYGVTHNGRLLYCSSDMRDAYSEQRVELDAARARIAELEAWQPIEKAPRDGSLFLCWVSAERWSQEDGGGSGRASDVSDLDFAQWMSMDDHPEGGYFMNMAGQIGDVQDITHWKALTPPVAAIARDGEGS